MVWNGFSQFEGPKKTLKISPVKNPTAPTSSVSNSPQVIKYESTIIKNPDDKLLKNFSLLPKKEEKGIMEPVDNHMMNPADRYTEKYNEKSKEDGLRPELFNRNMNLGDYVVNTADISIDSRDYGAIDGDLVRVWLNGQIVSERIYLESNFRSNQIKMLQSIGY